MMLYGCWKFTVVQKSELFYKKNCIETLTKVKQPYCTISRPLYSRHCIMRIAGPPFTHRCHMQLQPCEAPPREPLSPSIVQLHVWPLFCTRQRHTTQWINSGLEIAHCLLCFNEGLIAIFLNVLVAVYRITDLLVHPHHRCIKGQE